MRHIFTIVNLLCPTLFCLDLQEGTWESCVLGISKFWSDIRPFLFQGNLFIVNTKSLLESCSYLHFAISDTVSTLHSAFLTPSGTLFHVPGPSLHNG